MTNEKDGRYGEKSIFLKEQVIVSPFPSAKIGCFVELIYPTTHFF
jgi:hypothetical protein